MVEQKNETTAATVISNNCPKCGHHPKEATYKFCTRCGSKLKAD